MPKSNEKRTGLRLGSFESEHNNLNAVFSSTDELPTATDNKVQVKRGTKQGLEDKGEVRGASFTPEQIEYLDKTQIMLGCSQKSDALRWLVEAGWAAYGDEIEKVVKARKSQAQPVKL